MAFLFVAKNGACESRFPVAVTHIDEKRVTLAMPPLSLFLLLLPLPNNLPGPALSLFNAGRRGRRSVSFWRFSFGRIIDDTSGGSHEKIGHLDRISIRNAFRRLSRLIA